MAIDYAAQYDHAMRAELDAIARRKTAWQEWADARDDYNNAPARSAERQTLRREMFRRQTILHNLDREVSKAQSLSEELADKLTAA